MAIKFSAPAPEAEKDVNPGFGVPKFGAHEPQVFKTLTAPLFNSRQHAAT